MYSQGTIPKGRIALTSFRFKFTQTLRSLPLSKIPNYVDHAHASRLKKLHQPVTLHLDLPSANYADFM
jgi:hypothetical protein